MIWYIHTTEVIPVSNERIIPVSEYSKQTVHIRRGLFHYPKDGERRQLTWNTSKDGKRCPKMAKYNRRRSKTIKDDKNCKRKMVKDGEWRQRWCKKMNRRKMFFADHRPFLWSFFVFGLRNWMVHHTHTWVLFNSPIFQSYPRFSRLGRSLKVNFWEMLWQNFYRPDALPAIQPTLSKHRTDPSDVQKILERKLSTHPDDTFSSITNWRK